jgi:hypothetical protein
MGGGPIVDQMKPLRDPATQRLDLWLPLSFTTFEVGPEPLRLFEGRFAVSSITLQALSNNSGTIYVSNDRSVSVDYGIALKAGASVSWQVTLADILQVLGWTSLPNMIPRERQPDVWNPFRQSRVSLDAAQFWVVSDLADQHLTVQISHLPRY